MKSKRREAQQNGMKCNIAGTENGVTERRGRANVIFRCTQKHRASQQTDKAQGTTIKVEEQINTLERKKENIHPCVSER